MSKRISDSKGLLTQFNIRSYKIKYKTTFPEFRTISGLVYTAIGFILSRLFIQEYPSKFKLQNPRHRPFATVALYVKPISYHQSYHSKESTHINGTRYRPLFTPLGLYLLIIRTSLQISHMTMFRVE